MKRIPANKCRSKDSSGKLLFLILNEIMVVGLAGQWKLNSLGEKLIGDLLMVKNPWTHCPILSSLKMGNLDIMWLIIGCDRMHTVSLIFFLSLQIKLEFIQVSKSHHNFFGVKRSREVREVFINFFFIISPLRRALGHFFPNCPTCKMLILSIYCTSAFALWPLGHLPCGHISPPLRTLELEEQVKWDHKKVINQIFNVKQFFFPQEINKIKTKGGRALIKNDKT